MNDYMEYQPQVHSFVNVTTATLTITWNIAVQIRCYPSVPVNVPVAGPTVTVTGNMTLQYL